MVFEPAIEVDWLAIALSVIAGMVIGFVWYQPWFLGNVWMRGLPMQVQQPDGKGMGMRVGVQAVGLFLMVYVTLHILQAFMPQAWGELCQGGFESCTDSEPMDRWQAAGFNTLFLTLGYVLPFHFGDWAWKQHRWSAVGVDIGHHVVVIAAMSFIIAAFL